MTPSDRYHILETPNGFFLQEFPDPLRLLALRETLIKHPYFREQNRGRVKLLKLDRLLTSNELLSLSRSVHRAFPLCKELVMDRLVVKPGPSEQHTPWHQDAAYWEGRKIVRVWIPLDDFSDGAGHLKIHTHNTPELLEHTPSGIRDYFSRMIRTISPDDPNHVALAVKRYSVVFFNEKAIHASSANHSPQLKLVLTGMAFF